MYIIDCGQLNNIIIDVRVLYIGINLFIYNIPPATILEALSGSPILG